MLGRPDITTCPRCGGEEWENVGVQRVLDIAGPAFPTGLDDLVPVETTVAERRCVRCGFRPPPTMLAVHGPAKPIEPDDQ